MDGLRNVPPLPASIVIQPGQPQQDNSHYRQPHPLEVHHNASPAGDSSGNMRGLNQDAYQQALNEKTLRGRERTRDEGAAAAVQDGIEEMESPENEDVGPASSSRPRKRRRSRKGLDKKYECPQEGCGKSYSRAEHLYRHQLNHQPKQIYHCDYPDCKRSFVRQDLCTRHRDRHTNRGSQLQRKDNFMNSAGPSGTATRDRRHSVANKGSLSRASPTVPREIEGGNTGAAPDNVQSVNRSISIVNALPEENVTMLDGRPSTQSSDAGIDRAAKVRRTNSNSVSGPRPNLDGSMLRAETLPTSSSIVGDNLQQGQLNYSPPVSKASFSRPSVETSVNTPTMNMHGLSIQSPYATSSAHPYSGQPAHAATPAPPVTSSSAVSFNPQSSYTSFSLPQPAYPNMTQTSAADNTSGGFMNISPTSTALNQSAVPATSGGVMDLAAEYQMTHTIPIFGNSYSRSPQWQSADPGYFDWLLSNPDETQLATSQADAPLTNGFLEGSASASMSNLYGFNSEYPNSLYASLAPHPMAVNSIIAPPSPNQETLLSDSKRAQLFDLMNSWPDVATIAADSRGLRIDDDRVPSELSLSMMQTYISLYWVHFHPQLPILHRPTFAADKTPDALLLAIITIGAACMDYKADPVLAQAAADVALIIAKDLRFSIFNNNDFRPPAKLWVFQALLLLETYEKMYANRMLHERAHIHHATTLTLMRRGSSLTGGRSGAHDSPQSGRDMRSMSDTSSMTFSGQAAQGTGNTTDEAWSRWIVQEATKRVAFAAFILDSTHATMFGHSAVMVTHEMRLPLPCDEGLWSASTASELFRAQSSLTQAGFRPPMFLDALRKTLNGGQVRTNSFGRTILMAGLLSVSWNMNQRDIQITSLGVVPQLGGREKWRTSLTKSFDHWKTGFDHWLRSLRSTATNDLGYYISTEDVEHENIFESRTTLHHLAHMSMHVDIVDLQIYAGARQILGRTISASDMSNTRKRMKEWAWSVRARDAYLYAIQFLCQVMIPEERVDMHYNADVDDPDTPGSRVSGGTTGVPVYSARDDHLLNRPWILYYACLVVYAYALALEGPLQAPIHVPRTQAERHDDMRAYLKRVGNITHEPGKLDTLLHKNCCLGLLMTLQELFGQCRWELLVEASRNLQRCADILIGEVIN